MWIGTWAGSVNYFDRSYAIFDNIISGDSENMLNYNIVSGIVEDRYENLWIGTEGGGINYYDKEKKKFTYYLYDPNDEKSVSSNNIKSILKDKKGNLWIGTHDNGLNFLDTGKTTIQFERINSRNQNSKLLSNYKILSLFKDANENIWIGTLARGLLLYDTKLKILRKIGDTNESIQCIIAASDQNQIIIGESDELKMLTQNMATEWAKHNIQINGIGPGYFATPQTEPIRVDGHPFNELILNLTPAAKWGNPDDLAGATIFLASRASDFVNEHILYVDGGILATIGKPSSEN